MCQLLAQWRRDAGLTQRQLAAKLRRAPSIIAKIELADRRIDPIEFAAWCRACGKDAVEAYREAVE